MPLKDVVTLANKVYTLSNGSRKILKNLETLTEAELLNEIPKALHNKEIGTQLTKNLLDILVCAVQFQKYEISYDDALKKIKNISEEQQKVFSSPWLFSYDAALIEAYKIFVDETRVFLLKLSKERIDEKTIVQERLIAEYSNLKKQLSELEKSKNDLQEKYDSAIQENLTLSKKIQKIKKDHQVDLEKNSLLQKENIDIKNFIAGKKFNSNQKIIMEELSDYLILDWTLEKSYVDLVKLFANNETLSKLCKDTIDNLYKKAVGFYNSALFTQGNLAYAELKKYEKNILDTIALIAVYSYNHNKKDIGFLKSRHDSSPPTTPKGKTVVQDIISAKIKNFCEDILKRLRDVEQGLLSELSIYLRKPELTKKLLEEYSKNKMEYPSIAFHALDADVGWIRHAF